MGYDGSTLGPNPVSIRVIALVLALALIVPAALAVWRLEWVAARDETASGAGRSRALELAYAAVPVGLLGVLVGFAVVA